MEDVKQYPGTEHCSCYSDTYCGTHTGHNATTHHADAGSDNSATYSDPNAYTDADYYTYIDIDTSADTDSNAGGDTIGPATKR
jgi:hypothetical protein